jgi:hypothetical protein
MKEIDPDKSVYELTEAYPELVPLLKDLGFAGVSNPIARNTLGRATSLRKGCERQGKDLKTVAEGLEAKGFTVRL